MQKTRRKERLILLYNEEDDDLSMTPQGGIGEEEEM